MIDGRDKVIRDVAYNLVKTSYLWPRTLHPEVLNYGYNSLSGYSVLLGRLIYLRHKNLIKDRFPRYIARQIDEYFGKRVRKPNVWQEPVIRPRVFRLEKSTMFKGTVYVESKSKPTVCHRVRISAVEHNNASEERKIRFFRFMRFKCNCEIHDYQLFRNVPYGRRPTYGNKEPIDNRIPSDNPPPQVEMVICPEGMAAFNYLIEERGCESFGINKHVDRIIEIEIRSILDRKLPFWKLNKYLMEKTVLFKEFKAWERKKI